MDGLIKKKKFLYAMLCLTDALFLQIYIVKHLKKLICNDTVIVILKRCINCTEALLTTQKQNFILVQNDRICR